MHLYKVWFVKDFFVDLCTILDGTLLSCVDWWIENADRQSPSAIVIKFITSEFEWNELVSDKPKLKTMFDMSELSIHIVWGYDVSETVSS